MNYLVYIAWTSSQGEDVTDYHVIQAKDHLEAGILAGNLFDAIQNHAQSDSNKHSFPYEGKYYSGYVGVVGEVKP